MCTLNFLTVESGPSPEATVIWLHGLGADGHDFEDIVPQLGLKNSIRFIFPHAPEIPVTINGGYIMRAWYDILEMSIERRINRQHLQDSVHAILELVDKEIAEGMSSDRIVLAGFSQGGAVAYQTALNSSKAFAGLLTMSTYIADAQSLQYHEANQQIPILIQHGSFDPVVLEQQGLKAYEHLQSKGYQASYQNYPMEHHLCEEQVRAIGDWLNTILN